MAEKQKADSKKQTRVIDVTQPGKSAPSASSRPVIVGHGPMVKDPMMHEPDETSEEKQETISRAEPRIVAPLSGLSGIDNQDDTKTDKQPNPEDSTEVSKTPEVETSDKPNEADSDGSTPQNKEVKSSETRSDTENAVNQVDDFPVDADKTKKNSVDDKIQAEVAARQAEIDKLVKEEKFYVTTSESKSKRRFKWIFVLIILLVIVGGYLALDSQIIKNNVVLPYEFIKESSYVPASTQKETVVKEKADASTPDDQATKTTSQAKARDDERKADLRSLQARLENFFNDHAEYPQTLSEAGVKSEDFKDPSGNDYIYTVSADRASYTLTAVLENKQDPNVKENDGLYVVKSIN